ncbi:MAG: hypothetical protein LUC24_04580 [Bacteroidales bacterium]|nr:hypothetical protein [Bacteroidales bacterium]
MAAPKNRYDRAHLANIDVYQRMVTEIYAEASKAAGRLGDRARDGFDPDRPFSFDDFPALRDRADRLISSVSSSVTATVMSGISREWALANSKNDALVRQVFGKDIERRMTDALRERYFGANEDALKAFGNRRVAGMDLSERIWRRTEPFRTEMEDGIDAGLRDGLSAAEISRVIRQYLNHPDMRFRRVRDDHGELVLSRRAAAYHPGAGVYRSSYKNAVRLTGTEVNMAYRTADHERWKDMDMVVGIEIHLSNNHTLNGKPFTDICDSLAGQYPKSFKFTGWHPQCRCIATTILKTDEELAEDDRRILNGEEPTSAESSANYVKETPKNFNEWVAANKDRIAAAASGKGTLPYFIKDNQGMVDNIMASTAAQMAQSAENGFLMTTAATAGSNGGTPPQHPVVTAPMLPDDDTPKTLIELEEALQKYQAVDPDLKANEQHINAMMKELFDNNDFGLKIKLPNLLSVIKDGRFKNQFEVGHSGGYYVQDSNTGTLSIGNERMVLSHAMFNPSNEKFFQADLYTGPQFERREYEKYGMLMDRDIERGFDVFGRWLNYGDVDVRFKKDKVKCTWTFDDSLDGSHHGDYFQPSLTSDPRVESFDKQFNNYPGAAKSILKNLSSTDCKDLTSLIKRLGTHYIELQYHGDLSIGDVESLTFRDNPENLMDKGTIAKLKAMDIKIWYLDNTGKLTRY